jgi:hypothetical protein
MHAQHVTDNLVSLLVEVVVNVKGRHGSLADSVVITWLLL